MLRSIYERILGALRTNRRRPAPQPLRRRRLALESLESRKLLTVTTMTYGAISDGSFESPALSVSGYQLTPSSCPWQWSGLAGVSANNSGFTSGDPKAPGGTQVAFIKDNASKSQIV